MAWTKKALDKKEGILMLILYAIHAYLIYIRRPLRTSYW